MRGRVRVDLGDGDPGRAGDSGDLGAHRADRPVAEDRDGLARQVRDLRRVDGIAQGVQERADSRRHHLAVEGDDVEGRDRDVLGEAAVAVNPEDPRVLADVPLFRPAGAAVAAAYVHLGRNVLAFMEMRQGPARPERRDLAAELVSVDPRRLDHPGHGLVPLVDVLVRSADGRREHPDEDLRLAGLGNGHTLDFRGFGTRSRLDLDHGMHGRGQTRRRGDAETRRVGSSSPRRRVPASPRPLPQSPA